MLSLSIFYGLLYNDTVFFSENTIYFLCRIDSLVNKATPFLENLNSQS